jgi:uncharacterized protein YkwD
MPAISCPHCRKPISAPAAHEGSKGKCPHCGRGFILRAKPVKPAAKAKIVPPSRYLMWGMMVGVGAVVAAAMTVSWLGSQGPLVVKSVPETWLAPPQETSKPLPEKNLDATASRVVDPPPAPKEPPAPPPMPVDEQIAKLTAGLNDMRNAAKLPPVLVDAELSRGCQAHADYIAANRGHPKLATVAGLQDEDAALPRFSEEGKKAARASILAFTEPRHALERWFGRINSRPPFLYPDLERIGLGAAKSASGDWVTVVDVARGHALKAIAYPAPGQTNVPLNFSGGPEIDDALAGFPISLQFPPGQTPQAIDASFTDDRGNRVPVTLSTPQQPLPNMPPGLIGMIPKLPLGGKSTYHVRIACRVNERAIVNQWEFTTEDEGDEAGVWAAKVLERLNRVRRQADLAPVELDDLLSHACRLHAKYLSINARRPEIEGLGVHTEDPKLPGYTPEGAKAGKASDIALGSPEPTQSFDDWMATLYHRVPILDPGLHKVGFGCVRGQRLGWISVLDVFSGVDRTPRPQSQPVFWPASGLGDVPNNFPIGGETPDPIPEDKTGRAGYPITATFSRESPLTGAKATLEDANGKRIPCWFSSPELPANPIFEPHQGTTVCLIPKQPLQPEHTYRVTLTGTLAAAAWKKSWTFTTAKTGLGAKEAVRSVVGKINEIRKTAGLPDVKLDAEGSKRCQEQADAIVRRDDPGQSKQRSEKEFTVSNEPNTSAKMIYMHAPSPTVQVDDLLGSLRRRSHLLDAPLRRIALGCTLDEGRGWVSVLSFLTGRGDTEAVVFPADGQKRVPLQGRDRLPDDPKSVTGYPITVWFRGQPIIRNARATLSEATGAKVDVWLSTPDAPFEIGVPQTIIAIHPRRPMRPGHVYTVSILADVDGAEWRYSGHFSTE